MEFYVHQDPGVNTVYTLPPAEIISQICERHSYTHFMETTEFDEQYGGTTRGLPGFYLKFTQELEKYRVLLIKGGMPASEARMNVELMGNRKLALLREILKASTVQYQKTNN